MLTLGIRPGEYIVIGDNIVVKAVQLENQVQLGIEAPKDVTILRDSVYEQTHPTPGCIRRLREKDAKAAAATEQAAQVRPRRHAGGVEHTILAD